MMLATVQDALSALCKMSSDEATAFLAKLTSASRNDLVKAQWSVEYNKPGHDMYSVAEVSLANSQDALLQVWLRNAAAGIWIPENQPWVVSVVEFKPEQMTKAVKLGLLDSKWTADDLGRKYHYALWGYVMHDGKAESFAFEKFAIYPGDA